MAKKKEKETKYTEELNKYFHLSNSGLNAVLYKTEDGTKYPHTKIHLKTGTFGVMNTTLELIGCNHTEKFMSIKDLLELSAFFAQAAATTNEIEIQSKEQSVQHWKDIQNDKKSIKEGKFLGTEESILKRWNNLEKREKSELNKFLEEKDKLNALNDLIQYNVEIFSERYYPEKKFMDGKGPEYGDFDSEDTGSGSD